MQTSTKVKEYSAWAKVASNAIRQPRSNQSLHKFYQAKTLRSLSTKSGACYWTALQVQDLTLSTSAKELCSARVYTHLKAFIFFVVANDGL